MIPLKPKTIFFCTISSSRFLSSTYSLFYLKYNGASHFSSSSNPNYSSSSSRRHQYDEESRNVKVSVWWDFENCQVPSGVNVVQVAQRITCALRSNGIEGPITITAFGDVMQLSRSNQEALSSTGICLNHVPRGGKNSADRSLIVELLYWVSQNPPPAHLFLISGDGDFANILHRFRMSNYNVLLASREYASDVLCSASSIIWNWNSLVRGNNFNGKHFNQPPDGPYGSWYGYYKGPLEDPFPDPENSTEPSVDAKPRPVPRVLINKIHQILKAHPKGIPLSDLRAELKKKNMVIDKDYFGHKKFSSMVLSLSNVFRVLFRGSHLYIRSCQQKGCTLELLECNSKSSVVLGADNDEKDQIKTNDVNGGSGAMVADATEKSLSPSVDMRMEELLPERDSKSKTDKSTMSSSSDHEECFEQSHSYVVGSDIPVRSSSTCDGSERTTTKVESAEFRTRDRVTMDPNLASSSTGNISVIKAKAAKSYGKDDDKLGLVRGFFEEIMNWFRFWRPAKNYDDASGKSGDDLSLVDSQTGNHETSSTKADQTSGNSDKDLRKTKIEAKNRQLFSTVSFWDELESFVCSPRGSSIISKSKTRLEMAEKLQKEGPSALDVLSTDTLLDLADELITKKRWVEEYPSQPLPFKLLLPARKSSPGGPNVSSDIFVSESSRRNLQKSSLDNPSEEHNLNQSKSGINLGRSNGKPCEKSRDQMQADCQKLIAEILEECPEGFNMSRFKDVFFEKYGYTLICRRLGYQKLSSLLETMPGVKIESTFIIPSSKCPRDFSLGSVLPTDSTEKLNTKEISYTVDNNDDRGDVWEELGPVSVKSPNGKLLEFKASQKSNLDGTNDQKYSFSNAFSDLDKESLAKDESGKSTGTEEDSSLLQILDSWYTDKEGKVGQDQCNGGDDFEDVNRDNFIFTDSSDGCTKSNPVVRYSERKGRHQKDYTFVDIAGDEKEKMIESILGSMKKSADSG